MKTLTFLEKIADIRRRAGLKFDSDNPHFRGKFISLGGVLKSLQPLLDEHNLVLLQCPQQNGGVFGISTVIQECVRPVDEDGNPEGDYFLSGFWPCDTAGGNPQKIASATTYARRYSILCCLGLVAGDEDDDGNAASSLSERLFGSK
jgi:hypothetical protein